ncbi:Protein FAR1-RELATED SEQUENCE 5 [Bienertia sinuspersici]
MDKGVVEVEVDAMVVELEDSSHILDLEAPVEVNASLYVPVVILQFFNADVVGDVGCTPTKECIDVVTLAPPTVGMVFSSWKEAKDKTRKHRNAQWTCDRFGKPDRRRKVNGKMCVIDSQIEEDSGVKTLKKCECPMQIYASVNDENENEWVVHKVVNEHQNHNPTPLKSKFIAAHRKEEMNCHVKRKLKLGHSAGMKTTQRVESIHSFDDYVNKHTTLAEFTEMYCRAMEKRAEAERQCDAHSESFIWQIACGFPCESVFQDCHTDMKFKEIQHECGRIMFLHYFQNVVTFDNVTKYTFADRVWWRNKETKKEYLTLYKRNYRVPFDMTTKLAECECSLFNHSGIICSRKHMHVKVAYHDPSKTEHVVSYDEMQLAFEPICSKASVFKDTKQLVLEFLELLDIRVDEKRVMIEIEILNQTPSFVYLKDKQDPPRKAKPAHSTTDHRYYSAVEKAIKAKPNQKIKTTVSKGTSNLIDVNQGAIVSDIPMF